MSQAPEKTLQKALRTGAQPLGTALRFDHIEIRPAQREVWVGGVAVSLGARAYDLLLLLVEHRERVVSKDEIFAQVWPGLVVEENNLSVQISSLRRCLGAQAIKTSTGRGYQFSLSSPAGPPATLAVTGNIGARRTPLWGRESELAQLLAAFDSGGCLTVCGVGGVGKTALVHVAARELAAKRRYADGAWIVDLSLVSEPDQLPAAVGQTVGIEFAVGDDPLARCLAHLRHREILLVLDNCEHLIDATVDLVAPLLDSAPRVHVLATSQEPLRLAGERLLRLSPLAVPASAEADGALEAGAVQLMLERLRNQLGPAFEPSTPEFAELVGICQQLDGIPLALEFAASRVPLLGLAGVRSRLDDRLRLLAGGARSAPSRHQSLQAALEWSHQLLSPRSRYVLECLAVFPGGFSLPGARLLLVELPEAELLEHMDMLVQRSLLELLPGPPVRYRLLETTRAFAHDCLKSRADGVDWQARMVQAMTQLCVELAKARDSAAMWQEIPNARSALGWALAHEGQENAAVTLATYTSVVLAAGGSIGTALDNLRRVMPLVTASTPQALAARFWHWLGRLGVEGRLSSSQCIEALERADSLFVALGDLRHRHACQRHLAEAQLRAGRLHAAEAHLRLARELETDRTPASDRMRRLRVDALFADAQGRHQEALRLAQAALTLAEAHQVERYRLLLMADMAWTHLQMGQADASVSALQELLLHLDEGIRQGLVRARALSGLTLALVAAGRVEEAAKSAARTLRALQQADLLRSCCEVFAWLAAATQQAQVAAMLLGAGQEFLTRTETQAAPVAVLARQQTQTLLKDMLSTDEHEYWHGQGMRADDSELLHVMHKAFGGDGSDVSTSTRTAR